MILFHPRCIGSAVFGAAAVLAIAATSAAAAAPDMLACEGVFAKDTTHAKLVEAFGRSNVAVLDIDGDQGVKVKASVIHPDDSRRRVYVVWHDEKLRRRPATIRVDFKSGWHTVHGLHIGAELAEVEKANGRASIGSWEAGCPIGRAVRSPRFPAAASCASASTRGRMRQTSPATR
jgi:hypothetical protein